MTRAVYVIDAVRTPIGKYGGSLARMRPDDLAAHVVRGLVERNPASAECIDQVVFGDTNQAGEDNRNVARMAALIAGLSYEVAAVTVNRLCGSGLEAVNDAARMIALEEANVAIAGGVESMSRAPWVLGKAEQAYCRTVPELWDTTLGWRFPNPVIEQRCGLASLGMTAENVAKRHGISRADQDEFALSSHRRAIAAWQDGAFDEEVLAVEAPERRRADDAPVLVTRDESPRADTDLDRLSALRPAFLEDGTVTAGNSSPLNDGAAALLLAADNVVRDLDLKPLAMWGGSTTVGVDPNYMGEGPIPAVRKLLSQKGLRVPNLDLIELNEAFAAQVLACVRGLELDPERVNVRGGAIALGHPVGASGARIATTLVHTLHTQPKAQLGLATLCIGVGQGIATLFEKA